MHFPNTSPVLQSVIAPKPKTFDMSRSVVSQDVGYKATMAALDANHKEESIILGNILPVPTPGAVSLSDVCACSLFFIMATYLFNREKLFFADSAGITQGRNQSVAGGPVW